MSSSQSVSWLFQNLDRGCWRTSSKNCWVRCRMCLSSVSSRKFFFRASWLVLISLSSFSSFSNVACQAQMELGLDCRKNLHECDGLAGDYTSRSIISLGKGTSGFSPVSTIGMLAFLISFSTNPNQQIKIQPSAKICREMQTFVELSSVVFPFMPYK